MVDPILTVEEFAKLLKVTPQTIRKAINVGRIQAFRVGPGKKSPYRIYQSEIERITLMSLEETVKGLKEIDL